MTNTQMAKVLTDNLNTPLSTVFAAALTGASSRTDSEIQGPFDAVSYALEACRRYVEITDAQTLT